MEYDVYTVVLGDTLGKIAKQQDTDVDELAGINRISDPNLIYVGQQIKIPRDSSTQDEDFYNEQWICFVDPNGQPICNLKTRVVTADRDYNFTTDDKGFIPPIQTKHKDDKPQVFVSKLGGGEKKVATLSAPPGVHQQTLRSPKHKITVPLRKHDGLPDHDPSKPVKLEPGEVQHNRDLDGNPVINVGVECPNKDNLRLGPNSKYRDYILAAARKSGFKPQAIASIINIESAKKKTVVTKTFQVDGKRISKSQTVSTGEWDPDSSNPRSSAKGMTQFLKGTWLNEAKRVGTFSNQKALTNGWVTANASGQCSIVSQYETDILNLRMDAECAIMAAVDYGLSNFSSLAAKGYDFSKLNDGERAKILYLCHHLGGGDAYKYLAGTIVAEDTYWPAEPGHAPKVRSVGAKSLLTAQVGSADTAKRAAKYGGNYVEAHRYWLSSLIDTGVNFKNFACDPTKLEDVRPLLDLVVAVGGKKVNFQGVV
jgi:murein DD-endopeptidase MepM/ murein hydrolase activator NlpD